MNKEGKQSAEDTITLPRKEYERLLAEHAFLRQQLSELKRMIFGSKRERFIATDTGQTQLFDSESFRQEEASTPPSTPRKVTVAPQPKKKPVRALLPAHLPRKEEIIEPEGLTQEAKKIGEEITELLEYSPAKLFVRKIVRPKYAEPSKEGISIAELPALPLPKSNAGPGLLAHILVSKFVDHLPFYRQIQIFKRQDISLSKSTIGGWFNGACALLEPLYHCLEKKITAADYVQADESPIKVQDSHKQNAIHTGYHWLYHAPKEKLVMFKYSPGRARGSPEEVLSNFNGTLQTDGYAAYSDLKTKGEVVLAACMAHARRKFDKALDNDKARAEHALGLMQQLYHIEAQAREKAMSASERKDLRQQEALPVLQELETWLGDNLHRVAPKSPIGQAISYTIHLWPRLKLYAQDGNLEIDNNLIENQVRPLALGRKNYLFAGSHKAAQRAAIIYSLLGTCKRNGVEPLQWLTRTLSVISEHKANRLEELLPTNQVV